MDLQIWRELGDISSPEYAKKMVQVRKKQEQEFFNAGFDKSMIELLLELEFVRMTSPNPYIIKLFLRLRLRKHIILQSTFAFL